MPEPLRTVHVLLDPKQISYLRIKAARRYLSVSALLRELVERDIAREEQARKRRRSR
jgi:hypothetical protein